MAHFVVSQAKIRLAVQDAHRNTEPDNPLLFIQLQCNGRCMNIHKKTFTFCCKFILALRPTICTFVADVKSCVVVGLVGDELDPYSWTLADHSLKRYLSAVSRVKKHHRASVQSAPQHQPAGSQRLWM